MIGSISTLGSIEALTLAVNVATFLSIEYYKFKGKSKLQNLPQTRESLGLKDLETRWLASYSTAIIGVVAVSLSTVNAIVLNQVQPESLNTFPGDAFVFYALLVSPPLLGVITMSVYYANHPHIIKAFWLEVKEEVLKCN